MKYFVYFLLVLLIVLHQDFWWWHTHEPLVFGFIPIGLAWHAGISVAAAIVGGLGILYCWPAGVDDDDDAETNAPESKSSTTSQEKA